MEIIKRPDIPGSDNTAASNEKPLEGDTEKVVVAKGTPTMQGTLETINSARRKCTLSETVKNLLLTQLRAELSNYDLYSSFELYFENEGLPKISKYWHSRAEEELMHHSWIKMYLMNCGAVIQYPEVPITKVDITDRLSPFKDTVDREIETTGGINRIMNAAITESDWATVAFLLGDSDEEGKLIREQVRIFCLKMW